VKRKKILFDEKNTICLTKSYFSNLQELVRMFFLCLLPNNGFDSFKKLLLLQHSLSLKLKNVEISMSYNFK